MGCKQRYRDDRFNGEMHNCGNLVLRAGYCIDCLQMNVVRLRKEREDHMKQIEEIDKELDTLQTESG